MWENIKSRFKQAKSRLKHIKASSELFKSSSEHIKSIWVICSLALGTAGTANRNSSVNFINCLGQINNFGVQRDYLLVICPPHASDVEEEGGGSLLEPPGAVPEGIAEIQGGYVPVVIPTDLGLQDRTQVEEKSGQGD